MIEIQIDKDGKYQPLTLDVDQIHVIRVLWPDPILFRIRGVAYDIDRTFLAPAALESFEHLRSLRRANRAVQKILIVGHADPSGQAQHNLELSHKRATSMRAFLRRDETDWLDRFDSGDWAEPEEDALLLSLPKYGASYLSQSSSREDAIRAFQSEDGTLAVDGVLGPNTRKALIRSYFSTYGEGFSDLAIDATGVGEEYPLSSQHTEEVCTDDRRIEFFLHFGNLGPAASYPTKAYLQWTQQVAEVHDFIAMSEETVEVLLHDGKKEPIAGARFRVRLDGACIAEGDADDEGIARFRVPAQNPEHVTLDWSPPSRSEIYDYTCRVYLDPDTTDDPLQARLSNLGYRPSTDLNAAVSAFQHEFEIDHAPMPTGLVQGSPPQDTQARLDAIFSANRVSAVS